MATKNPSAARKILDQFASLPARERALALVAFIGFFYLVCDFAWYRPQAASAKALQVQLAQLQEETKTLSTAVQTVSAESPKEATSAQRAERDRLKSEVELAETVVRQAQSSVRIGEVIRTLASQSPSLTVVSLRTVPSTLFFNASTAQAAAAAANPASGSSAAKTGSALVSAPTALPNIYRHGVEVTLRGPYSALVGYIQALEQGTSGVFWGPARLETQQYPETQLRVTLYMISVQPELTFD